MKRRRFCRCLAVVALSVIVFSAYAQDDKDYISREGTVVFCFGMGGDLMSDSYRKMGTSFDFRARYYYRKRAFFEMLGAWTTHSGDKDIVQADGSPFALHDQRDCLFGAVGPGFDIFQSEGGGVCVFVKGLVGYGSRKSTYDDIRDNGTGIMATVSGCEKTKTGFGGLVGTGVDFRLGNWSLSPSVNALYAGGGCNVTAMLSIGYQMLF